MSAFPNPRLPYVGNGPNDYVVIIPPVYKLNETKVDNGCIEYEFSIIGIIGLKITLCYDPIKIKVCVTILGVPIPCVEGDPQEGITISIDAWVVTGYLRFYLQDIQGKNCVWLEYDLKVFGASTAHGNDELFCI